MESLVIRRSCADDLAEMARLSRAVFAETYGPSIPPGVLASYLDETFAPSKLALDLTHKAVRLHVARHGAQVVGLAHYVIGSHTACVQADLPVELFRLYVDRKHRGSGVAGQLVQRGLEEALAEGADTMWLCAWRHNPRALAFYRRYGFAIVGAQPVYVYDIAFDDVVMSLSLL